MLLKIIAMLLNWVTLKTKKQYFKPLEFEVFKGY